jgi:DedD protein
MQWEKELEFKVEDQGDDKEVTLGPLLLTALGLGLLVLCSICFLVGYTVGHRAQASNPSGVKASSSGLSAAELLALTPSTRPASGSPTPASHTAPDETAGSLTPVAAAQEPAPPPHADELPNAKSPESKSAAPSAVRAALTQSTAQAGSWVVQVAAVEDSTDADVLVNALRQRGYSVSARHSTGDNLIHVQIGPFASRSDADSMRQKLLNDGYNANVEP